MSKYHIGENGPAVCRASKRPCPVGGEHFDSQEEAVAAFESAQGGSFGETISKNLVDHVLENDAMLRAEVKVENSRQNMVRLEMEYREHEEKNQAVDNKETRERLIEAGKRLAKAEKRFVDAKLEKELLEAEENHRDSQDELKAVEDEWERYQHKMYIKVESTDWNYLSLKEKQVRGLTRLRGMAKSLTQDEGEALQVLLKSGDHTNMTAAMRYLIRKDYYPNLADEIAVSSPRKEDIEVMARLSGPVADLSGEENRYEPAMPEELGQRLNDAADRVWASEAAIQQARQKISRTKAIRSDGYESVRLAEQNID